MEKLEKEGSGWKYIWKAVFLKGNPQEVKEALISWAEKAFQEVQGRARVRKVRIEYTVGSLVRLLERGWPYKVEFDWGGDMYFGESTTSVFIGAFHRLGESVWVGATIARLQGWGNHYRMAYNIITREYPWARSTPPERLPLLARAITRPEKARLMERLDLRRRNLEALKDLLPPSLAKPLAGAVPRLVRPRNLQVFDGVALYRDGQTRLLVFDGMAHWVEDQDWPLVRKILRRKEYTPLERARMAMAMVRLGR